MFKRLFSVGLIISYAFASDSAIVDTTVCVSNKVRVPICSYNPLADMRLSPYPLHQSPPLFMGILPDGQRIIFLGTTHNFPLACMLPYALAQDLIEHSSFNFSEIYGTLLGNNGSAKGSRSFKYKDIPDFAFVSEESKAKLREGQVLIYKEIYRDLIPLEEYVDQQMSSIFDSHGRWYEKAGIVVRKIGIKSSEDESFEDECHDDQNECKGDDHPTHLVLKVRGNELSLPIGKELHPVALGILEEFIMKEAPYQIPCFGGMDKHLYYMAKSRTKEVFSLEKEEDRFGDGAMEEFRLSIEESLQSVTHYKCYIENTVKKPRQPHVEVDEAGELDIVSYSPANFYSDAIPELLSPSILERNDLWVTRIMATAKERFNIAFGYVGMGHLVDLLKKLKANGCRVSDRLSLADLEEILLDEPAILQGHEKLKEIYRHLRF